MPVIDKRLNKPDCEMDITENFNRVLGIIDGLANKIQTLEERIVVLESVKNG